MSEHTTDPKSLDEAALARLPSRVQAIARNLALSNPAAARNYVEGQQRQANAEGRGRPNAIISHKTAPPQPKGDRVGAIPRQVGAGNNPLPQTPRRRPIHKRLPARTRPVPQSLDPLFLITFMPLIGRGSAEPAKPPCFRRFHPLEQVGDHQNPADIPRPLSCRAKRRSSAAPGSLRKK